MRDQKSVFAFYFFNNLLFLCSFRYLVYLNGREVIRCLLNFGFFLHFFLCIQVIQCISILELSNSWSLFISNLRIRIIMSLFSSTIIIYAAKMWCYSRSVYLPMSYLYGKRFVGPITPLILQLRQELFVQPYNQTNWDEARHLCAKVRYIFPANYHIGKIRYSQNMNSVSVIPLNFIFGSIIPQIFHIWINCNPELG